MLSDVKCKRIIDGKTYNTETSTQIAGRRTDDREADPFEAGEALFKNRFGAFFLYDYLWGMEEHDYEKIKPFSADEARKWLEKNYSWDPSLIERHFGKQPEAGSGESKFTLRMPDVLRDQLAQHAKTNGQSLNAWIIRCLESCASRAENS